MTRIPTTFKLSQKTKEQISWLKQRLGDVAATDVVAIAVADLYERKQAEFTARLVARDNGYDLQIGDITVANCEAAVIERLPQPQRDGLVKKGAPHSGVLAALALSGAATGEKITLYPEAINLVYGPQAGKNRG